MSRKIAISTIVSLMAIALPVSAGIPEPDAVVYGTLTVNGQPAEQQDDYAVLARLGTGEEIGRYDFSDCNADGVRDVCELSCANAGCTGVTGCGTARDTDPADGLLDDCPGNLFALKIRCESVPAGLTPSGNAAVLNPTTPPVVQILVKRGDEPEVLALNLPITDRGMTSEVNLNVQLQCSIADSFPPDCAVDARQPSNPDGSNPAGWSQIELTLTCDPGTSGLNAGSFGVSSSAGTTPTISNAEFDGNVATLTFNARIPVGAWTCVSLGGSQACLGSLPADASGDRTAAAPDILRLIDCLNGVAVCEMWQCDTDRSNVCGPPDILRIIDLLNGASAFDPWLNVSIGACPTAP